MNSDFSRQRFDPRDDFASVLMQQGRVLLDADWNEWAEILDRRLRVETTDIIGRCVVPKETLDGFKIGIAGGNLTIGPGRCYVDGLPAENHGGQPDAWDPVPAELRGTTPITYDQQPYLKDAATGAPLPTEGGPHLVFLDVWRREVTWLQDPRLVENAVGVDSTSRWQTAWQVRVLPNVGSDVTCATPDAEIPGWLDATRPSAGRLTTDTFDAPDEADPCDIPPTGGYKGRENRLYRVEIDSVDAGTGAATFKWARHNASVATAVRAISGQELVVDRTGRDADLRFKVGDWVEITDDLHELSGRPGILRKVQDVEDATRTITLESALPAGAFASGAADLAARHTRLQRWDQRGQVRDTAGTVHFDLNGAGSQGVIPVPTDGKSLLLEDGIQVTFSLDPAGGRSRTGDYWVFAARVADASIEKLTQAPPRGIHHHYGRLALVTFPATVVDCRTFWPPETGGTGCDCTVCVTPESHQAGTLTIQQAIDQVRTTGGTVCLDRGVYPLLETPLRVEGAQSVRIRGQGWRTMVVHMGPGPSVAIRRSLGVVVENLSVLTSRVALGAADLTIQNSADVTVQGCYFVQVGPPELPRAAIGLGGVLFHTRLLNNLMYTAGGIANVLAEERGERPGPLLTLGLRCEDNRFACDSYGVRLEGLCLHLGDTVIARNYVEGARDVGLMATGAVLSEAWGGSHLEIASNALLADAAGIVVGTDDARIHGNDIGPGPGARSGDGIVIDLGLRLDPLNRLQVTNNRVQQRDRHGIFIRAPIRSGLFKQNQIEAVGGGGIIMDEDSSAELLVIENNKLIQVANLDAATSEGQPLLAGIHVVRARDATVASNTAKDIGARASLAPRLVGIQMTSCTRARVSDNRIVNLGPPVSQLRDADAIAVVGLYEHLDITDNVVRRHESPPAAGQDNSIWRAVRVGQEGNQPLGVGGAVLVRTAGTEAFLTAAHGFVQALVPGAASVRGNALDSFGGTPAVWIVSSGRILVNDNRASLLPPGGEVVVRAVADAIIMSHNHIDGGRGDHDVVWLQGAQRAFAVLGNIASGIIRHNGNPLQNPWKSLNVEMV
jgi:hypothetical protein